MVKRKTSISVGIGVIIVCVIDTQMIIPLHLPYLIMSNPQQKLIHSIIKNYKTSPDAKLKT